MFLSVFKRKKWVENINVINEKLITRIDFRYSTTRSVNIKEFSDWLETKLRIDSEYNLK